MLNKLNKYLNSGIILTIVFLLVGGILIVKPDISFNIISYLIGGIFIIFGIIKISLMIKRNYYYSKWIYKNFNWCWINKQRNEPFRNDGTNLYNIRNCASLVVNR